MGRISMAQVRTTQWAHSYHWDFAMPEIPGLFPAVQLSASLANLGTQEFSILNGTYPVPAKQGPGALSVDFTDTDQGSILIFLKNWVRKEIFNDGKFVSPLSECVKQAVISKLSVSGSPVWTERVLIFPVGNVTFTGNSDSGLAMFSQEFVIAGYM